VAAENLLLTLLDSATRSQLKPQMRTITVEHGEVLHGSSSEFEFAYFPQSTIVSVLARTEQGVLVAHFATLTECDRLQTSWNLTQGIGTSSGAAGNFWQRI
jgi:hypothetical protein